MKIFKEKKLLIIYVIIVIISILINIIITKIQYNKYQTEVNNLIGNIVGYIEVKYPEVDENKIIELLNQKYDYKEEGIDLLKKYGINEDDAFFKILENKEKSDIIKNTIFIVTFSSIIFIIVNLNNKKKDRKLDEILKYIKEINNKNYNLKIEDNKNDELSYLRNELYKITVMLKNQSEILKTEKQNLQRALEDISHQIKTPLTSIGILLDNLIQNPYMEKETRDKFIEEINEQVNLISNLIITLLKLARLDTGVIEFQREKIYVNELINEIIHNLKTQLNSKNQEIVLEGKKEVTFLGDYNWEREAITNILKNCIENTENNKKIYIYYEKNNFYTKIVIKDEGRGIEKEEIKHIFERFYKGKNSNRQSIGIGLSFSKAIIEKDNGKIICKSKMGEGSIFEIKYLEK